MIKYILALLMLCSVAKADNFQNFTLSNMGDGWFDDWEHQHFSKSGSPYVHLFGLEPAFLDRDLFVDYVIINGKDEFETEVEVELEWALTSRIGLILELPWVIKEEPGESTKRGLEDAAVGLRFLLYRDDSSALSLNLGLGLPTGDNDKGLSEDEYSLSYSLSYWKGFNENLALNLQVGIEQGLETDNKKAFYKSALVYTIYNFSDDSHHDHDHDHDHSYDEHGKHFPRGMLNLITEFSGEHDWDEEKHTSELLFGISYLVTDFMEIRFAYQIPLQSENELQDAYIFSTVFHF